MHTRLRALNVHDAVLSLVEGGCDLVMGYHHPSHPVALDPARYDMLTLGIEPISPFSAPGRAGRPRYTLPGTPDEPAPYLSYTPNAYLGRMTEVIIANAPSRLYLDHLYETDMAEGLKAMALAGHGIAFLPHSAVEDAVAEGKLIRLDRAMRGTPEGQFTLTMEIRLYRDKLAAQGEDARQVLVRQALGRGDRRARSRRGVSSPEAASCALVREQTQRHRSTPVLLRPVRQLFAEFQRYAQKT